MTANLKPLHDRTLPAGRILMLAVTALTIVFAGCGQRELGSGVVLWSPDETTIASGSVVTVLSESDISDTYTVTADQASEPLEIVRWRVALFEDAETAAARAREYAASLDGNALLRARARRNALPMRSQPVARGDNTVYRLRTNEEIKLIGRESEQTNLEGLVSYWYEALTDTGVRGWVFGYTLEVFDPTNPDVVVDTGANSDPLVDLLLQNVWRPVSYVDMISAAAIDLERFRPEYGLFPDPENRQLELVLADHATIFEYEQIARVGNRRYIARGTSLQLTFQPNDTLSIQYELNGQQHLRAMARVDGEIEEYRERELERRASVYEDLLERGPEFASNAYGTILFSEGEQFLWTGYERLVPAAIPEGAGNSGRLDLGLFLSRSLMQQFDGAVSFRFDGADAPVSFAYAFRDGGIRLVWIPAENIADRIVRSTTASPLTIFMSAAGG